MRFVNSETEIFWGVVFLELGTLTRSTREYHWGDTSSLTFTDAFARYGATLRNIQWSVCAEAPDGSLVVSLWQHDFEAPKKGRIVCRDSLARWSGPGNNEFRERLIKAFATNQVLRVVIAHAENEAAVRSGASAAKTPKSFSVRQDWKGRVISIDGDNYAIEFGQE